MENKKICRCRNIYYEEIEEEIKGGITNIEELMNKTGVATCCGGCFSSLKKLIQISK